MELHPSVMDLAMGFTIKMSLATPNNTGFMKLIGNTVCLVTKSRKITNLGIRFRIFSKVLSYVLSGLYVMIRLSTKSNAMNSRLRTLCGKNALSMESLPLKNIGTN